MSADRVSNWSKAMRRRWLETAICPHCEASNIGSRSMLIELQADGRAHCNSCDHTFDMPTDAA